MIRILTATLVAAIAVPAMTLTMPGPAEAVTCSSVCNQVRRACQHSAKGVYKAAKIECGQERAVCHSDCAANADNCGPDCDAAQSACIAGCGGVTACIDDCNSAALQCHDDCVNCDANCDAAAKLCKDDAKAARDLRRDYCTGSRTECDGQCTDPIDGVCVKGCTSDEHACTAAVKRDVRSCKKSCPTAAGRKACFNECKRSANAAASVCEDDAVLCYAGCAGVTLSPPTTTTTVP